MRTTALLAALLLAGAAVLPRNAQAQDAPAPERTGALAEPAPPSPPMTFMIATANPLASRAGPRRARRRRLGRRRGDRRPDGAERRRAAELRPRRRRLRALLGRGDRRSSPASTAARPRPAAATPAYWLDDAGEPREFWDAVVGGRSVGVPGTLLLMETLHAALRPAAVGRALPPGDRTRRGRLPDLAAAGRRHRRRADHRLADFPAARALYLHQDGSPKARRRAPAQPRPRADAAARRRRGQRAASTTAPSPATSSPRSGRRPTPAC